MMEAQKAELSELVERGRRLRDAGYWTEAIACYSAADEIMGSRYDIKHNLAMCLLAANRAQEAQSYLAHAIALKSDLWPSHILKARILKSSGEIEAAAAVLMHVLKHDPKNGHALLAAADLDMNEFGDPLGARDRVIPLLNDPGFKGEAELTTLMSKLYDRTEGDEELSSMLIDFAQRELSMPEFKFSTKALSGTTNRTGRKRIGLLSPMFCVSPVYFLTFSAFQHLSRYFDIIVLNRGFKEDWGTKEFRGISTEWYDVQNLEAPALANEIKQKQLDVLFDLGGWSDPIGLKALSVKPASLMYKWVGGQSATTGLTTFDGFITDEVQSPLGSEKLHSEPLIRIADGYVCYKPPPYMPKPAANSKVRAKTTVLAGNPAKLSSGLLESLRNSSQKILFIDRRYKHNRVIRRLSDHLRGPIEFIAPKSHREYLSTLCSYEHFTDTWPYSSGLTAVEILTLGKSINITQGKLVSSRHSASHVHYARLGQIASNWNLLNWGMQAWQN